MMKQRAIFVFISIFLLSIHGTRTFAATASFQGLGDLLGGNFFSQALDVSADGSVVVGTSRSSHGEEAFRWTAGGGMVGLGFLPGGDYSHASAVSGDGSVVVGNNYSFSGNLYRASYWTSATGMVDLGDLPGGCVSGNALGVSADGSTVVGYSHSSTGSQAFRWTSASGMVGLGHLSGGTVPHSYARDVSADGSVVVGFSYSSSGTEAFRWTSTGGMVGLGDLLGGNFHSTARAVSADGTVVVGHSDSGSATVGNEAFMWTASDGIVGLGDLAGGHFASNATGVSADGSVIVGAGYTDSGYEPFIWDSANSMRSLTDVLTINYGLDLTGWALTYAQGISDDGSTIVGYGMNPAGDQEAWIATLDEAAPVADAGGPYFMDIGDPPIMLAGSVVGSYNEAAWDLDLDGLYDDAFGLNPSISSDMLASWGFSPGMTWDIGFRVSDLYGNVDVSMTELTFVPTTGALLLGSIGLSLAGWKLRRRREG